MDNNALHQLRQARRKIETLVVQAGEADSRDTAEAVAWALENREELRSRWREYSEEESPQEKP